MRLLVLSLGLGPLAESAQAARAGLAAPLPEVSRTLPTTAAKTAKKTPAHLAAGSDGALIVTEYVRGDDLLAVMRPNGSGGWASRFYHSDHIGSVRRLTDESGAITDGYTYSAFGELLGHTGTDPQPYAFTGEPYDPNVGFQYHRARWMDPRVGRFVASDPWAGRAFEPLTLHKYLYANADPLRRTDPTGLFSAVESISVAYVMTTLTQLQATVGFAVMDQIQYGGDAGIQSLLLGAAGAAVGIVAGYAAVRLYSRMRVAALAVTQAQRHRELAQEARILREALEGAGQIGSGSASGRARNIGLLVYDLDGIGEGASIGISGGFLHPVPGTASLPTSRQFASLTVRASSDAELKLLEELAGQLRPDATGRITLYSELPFCTSCLDVVEQFRASFPGVQVELLAGVP